VSYSTLRCVMRERAGIAVVLYKARRGVWKPIRRFKKKGRTTLLFSDHQTLMQRKKGLEIVGGRPEKVRVDLRRATRHQIRKRSQKKGGGENKMSRIGCLPGSFFRSRDVDKVRLRVTIGLRRNEGERKEGKSQEASS